MKKLLFVIAAISFALAAPSFAAQTDTDYLCLDHCMKDGKTSAICLPKCSHNPAGKQARVTTHTDYRCITLCMSDGKSSGECLPKCTYAGAAKKTARNITGAPIAGIDQSVSTRKVLEAPVPAGDTLYMPSHISEKNKKGSKDYACIAQCLQDGMQYQLCNQNCAEVTPEFNKFQ